MSSTDNTDQQSAITINENRKVAESNGGDRGNGTKAFAGVIALLLVISGVYSMIEPMNQNISYITEAQEKIRLELREHEKTIGHSGLIEQQAIAGERFKEIETQFKGLREIMDLRYIDLSKHVCEITEQYRESLITIAVLEEKMKNLNKKIDELNKNKP